MVDSGKQQQQCGKRHRANHCSVEIRKKGHSKTQGQPLQCGDKEERSLFGTEEETGGRRGRVPKLMNSVAHLITKLLKSCQRKTGGCGTHL